MKDNELDNVEIMSEEEEAYSIKDDNEADKAIERIKKLRASKDRLVKLFNERVEDMKIALDNHIKAITNKEEFYSIHIKSFIGMKNDSDMRITKSGSRIYDLISGKVTLKKSVKFNYDNNNEEFIKFIKDCNMPYIKSKESVDWAEMKKNVIVENGMVIADGGIIIPDQFVHATEETELKIG